MVSNKKFDLRSFFGEKCQKGREDVAKAAGYFFCRQLQERCSQDRGFEINFSFSTFPTPEGAGYSLFLRLKLQVTNLLPTIFTGYLKLFHHKYYVLY